MSRFSYANESTHRLPRILWMLVPVVMICAFVFVVRHFGTYSEDKQRESLENALRRDIIQCYAIEGFYPPSDAYLEEHYGLVYDKSRFHVDYKNIGANMYPDVTVLEKGGQTQ